MASALLEAARRPKEQRELQDAMVKVWADLDSLDVEAERRIMRRVAEVRAEIVDRITALGTTTDPDGNETWQVTSLRALESDLRRLLVEWSERLSRELGTDLTTAAELADEGYRGALSQLARSLDVPPAMIRLSTLGVSSGVVQAAVLYHSSAVRGVSERIATEVNGQIQRVVFGGQSRHDAVRNIRDLLAADPKWAGKDLPPKTVGKLTQQAITIERTGVMQVFNIAADHAYREALDELLDLEVEWQTVKDKRVDPKCEALHGKRKRPRGTFPGGVIAPPLHARCRCRTVAFMPRWVSLGAA